MTNNELSSGLKSVLETGKPLKLATPQPPEEKK
jgi:hypothetical protein